MGTLTGFPNPPAKGSAGKARLAHAIARARLKLRNPADDSMIVTDVEALLSVDAGRVPPNTVVFVATDPGAPTRRLLALLSATLLAGAAICALEALGREPVILLALAGAILAVMALPTKPDPDQVRHKPRTLVVTSGGFIMRGARGLRSWRYEDLADAHSLLVGHRTGLLLVKRNGARELLDVDGFSRSGLVASAIRRRLHRRGV